MDLASGWLGPNGASWSPPAGTNVGWSAPTADELMGNLRNSEVEFARLNERISSQWFPSDKDTRDLALIGGRIHWLQQQLDVPFPIEDLNSIGRSQRASVVGAAAAKLGDEGAVAVDTFSLGYALHDRSEHAQVEALRSGDIASQFAFGISKVGGRAGQAAVVVGGGYVATPLVVGAVGQSAAATAGTYLVYGGAGLGVAGTVVSARNAYDAYEAGNYIDTIGGAGDAALSAAGAFAGGRSITNRRSANPSVLAAEPRGNFYSAAFETRLNAGSYPGVSRAGHFQEANESLLRMMEADSGFAQSMRELGVTLERTPTGLVPRQSPAGWSWHHAQEPGVMQLVPRAQHAPGSIFQDVLHPNGRGGYSIWGQ